MELSAGGAPAGVVDPNPAPNTGFAGVAWEPGAEELPPAGNKEFPPKSPPADWVVLVPDPNKAPAPPIDFVVLRVEAPVVAPNKLGADVAGAAAPDAGVDDVLPNRDLP